MARRRGVLPLPLGPTWVYRLRCEHDALLYVGIACDLHRRLRQHAATKDWWGDVIFVDAELYPTRLTARKVETYAIVYERPKYNHAQAPDGEHGYRPIGRRHFTSRPYGLVLEGFHGSQANEVH